MRRRKVPSLGSNTHVLSTMNSRRSPGSIVTHGCSVNPPSAGVGTASNPVGSSVIVSGPPKLRAVDLSITHIFAPTKPGSNMFAVSATHLELSPSPGKSASSDPGSASIV